MWGFAHNDCTAVASDGRYVYVATLEGARRYDPRHGEVSFEAIPPEQGPAARLSPQIEDGWTVYVTPEGVVLDDLYSITPTEEAIYWGGRGRLFASGGGAEGWREIPAELPAMAVVRRLLRRGGTLVIATDAGLFEYDGERTSRMPGVLGRLDAREALSFAGLEYYATAEGLFVRRPDGEAFKFASGTRAKWKKVKEASKKQSPLWRLGAADGLPSSRCTALASWGETVVVGTENGACLLEPATGEIRPVPLARGLPPEGVYALASGDQKILAATPRGLASLDDRDYAVTKVTLPGAWNDVRDVIWDDGEVLITSRAGVVALPANTREPKTFGLYGLRANYPEIEGWCARECRGKYFVGTSEGVLELDGELGPVRPGARFPGYEGEATRALLAEGPFLLWATRGGGLGHLDLDSGELGAVKAGEGISADVLFSLAADSEHVYVGTYDKGVDILDKDLNFERNVTWGDGLSHTDIWAAAADPPWLWLSIRGVGINALHLETGEVRRYYARYGLGDEYCKAVAVLPPREGRKRLAFGTASGVAVLEYDGDPPDYTEGDYDANYP
jgi:hypothetical protein